MGKLKLFSFFLLVMCISNSATAQRASYHASPEQIARQRPDDLFNVEIYDFQTKQNEENGSEFCDLKYKIHNISDKRFDDIEFTITWKYYSKRRKKYYPYSININIQNFEPQTTFENSREGITKWCKIIETLTPKVTTPRCILQGRTLGNRCSRTTYSFARYDPEKAQQEKMEKLKSSEDESVQDALKLLDETANIELPKTEEDENKEDSLISDDFNDILNSINNLEDVVQ